MVQKRNARSHQRDPFRATVVSVEIAARVTNTEWDHCIRADKQLDRIDAFLKDWSVLRKSQPSKSTELSYLNEKLILTPAINYVAKRTARTVIWEAIPAMDSPANVQRKAVKAIEGRKIDFLLVSLIDSCQKLLNRKNHGFTLNFR